MNQIYLCPGCRSEVKPGERFCGNCGFALNWQATPQTPQTGYQSTQQWLGQQQGWNQAPTQSPQQPGWQQPAQYQQQPWGYTNPRQQQYPYGGYYGQQQKKSSNTLIIFLVILIIILFTIGGIGLATKGTFSFSSTVGNQQYANVHSNSVSTLATGTASAGQSFSETSATTASTTAATTSPTTSTAIPEISAAKIIEDYNVNAVYAGTVYGGKTYIISGIIKSYSSASSPMYISIAGNTGDTLWIECRFEDGSESVIESLTIGQNVKIQGKVNSYNLDEGAVVVIFSRVVT